MIDGHAYRFETAQQWRHCLRLQLQAHRRLAAATGEALIRLDAAPAGFIATAVDCFAWIDAAGALRRDGLCAGPVLGQASRLTEGRGRLWALADEALRLIDGATLQLLLSISAPNARDLAADGSGGVWLLTTSAILHFDAQGRSLPGHELPHPADRIAVVDQTIFLLSGGSTLMVLRPAGAPLRIALRDVPGDARATFSAQDMRPSGAGALLIGEWDGAPGFLAFDADGDAICSGVWEGGAPVAVAALGSALVAVFAESGGWTVRRIAGALMSGGEVLVTPVLETDTLAAVWLRAELSARLPRGATLAIGWASTGDEALVAMAEATRADDDMSHAERLRRLHAVLPWSAAPVTYSGGEDSAPRAVESFAAPLGEAAGNYLWLEIMLSRNQADVTPELLSLVVAHDVPGLIDYLPAVYRTPTGDADGTLRRLVEVLEATFLGFDAGIAKLADRLDPDRTEARWLASLAQLLGLPFDDALDTSRRRALLRAAPEIIAGRGARAGLLALLTALFGDRPYRIIDRTEQFIPITLGGGACVGSRLPGFLPGPSDRVAKLNARLVLGRTPLRDLVRCDDMQVSRSAELLVIVPVTDGERRRLGAAVRQMLQAMMPAGLRLDVRWTPMGRASGGAVLAVLDDTPMIALGGGGPLSGGRLDGSREPRLRDGGIAAEHRLS